MIFSYELLFLPIFANTAIVGSLNRDPADRPENSYVPDVAGAIDSPEDHCRDEAMKFWRRVGIPDNPAKLAIGTARFALEFAQRHAASGDTEHSDRPEILARILAAIIDSGPAALLTAQCIDFVTETNVQGPSLTEADIGRKHHLSRAAVSKRCILLCDELGLSPARGMRKLSTRRKYRLRQRGRRARSARPPWEMGKLFMDTLYGR